MQVFVTGAQGMLGQDLVPVLKAAGDVVIPSGMQPSEEADFVQLDITDLEATKRVIAAARPDVVINCAAYTNVDGAEADPDSAYRVNALGTWNLALACQEVGAAMLLVSTDYVFDGTKGSAYDEYDTPNPQSVYGRSKYAGEQHLQQMLNRFYIVRTAWLYGHHGKNFVETILKAAAERAELQVVNDQWGCPTWTKDLAEAINQIIRTGRYGIYHATGEGACTWMDFARKIVELGGRTTPVLPQTTEELNRPAPRPRYSVMRNQAIELAGMAPLPAWEESLEHYMANRPMRPMMPINS
ncbi:dTDP-4-dehydrorhamnose reductase [compost metagenome]